MIAFGELMVQFVEVSCKSDEKRKTTIMEAVEKLTKDYLKVVKAYVG